MAKRRVCRKPLANFNVGKKEWVCCGGKRAPRCQLVRPVKVTKSAPAAAREAGDFFVPPSAAAFEKELRYAERKTIGRRRK
jgi:hypothetical protein